MMAIGLLGIRRRAFSVPLNGLKVAIRFSGASRFLRLFFNIRLSGRRTWSETLARNGQAHLKPES